MIYLIVLLKKNPTKGRYVTSGFLFIKIHVWGVAKSFSWAATKYSVEVGGAVTKHRVGVDWPVTKYRVEVGWAVTKY